MEEREEIYMPNKIRPRKTLYRSKNRMLSGVCGGIGEYFSVDPTLVRLIAAFFGFASVGTALIAYIIAAIVIPDNPDNTYN